MARTRLLHPGFFKNETLAELPPLARLLFAGLWTLADREGRLEDRPRRLKVELLPWDDCDVHDLLAALEAHGFIQRYELDGQAFIAIPSFTKYQKPHQREAASAIPAAPPRRTQGAPKANLGAPKADLGDAKATPRRPVSVSVSVSDPVSVSHPVPTASLEDSAAVLTFACEGLPPTWALTRDQVATWQALFPSLEVQWECARAYAWLEAAPARRKTAKGMARFLLGWLNRSQERLASAAPAQKPTRSYTPTAHADYDAWPSECARLHGGTCAHYQAHQLRLAKEAAA